MSELIVPPNTSRVIRFTVIDDDMVECGGKELIGWCGVDDEDKDSYWFYCPENNVYWEHHEIKSWREIE